MKYKLFSFCIACLLMSMHSIAFSQKEFFIPKALLMPFHNRHQQLHLSAGIGGGYDVNLSYSLSRHLALFATGTFNKGPRKRASLFGDNYNIVKHDRVFTYGAGYFKQPKGKLNVLETYAGYGINHVNNYWYFTAEPDLGNNYTQASYQTIFWQVNMGRTTAKYNYGFAGRLSYSSYKNILFYDSNPNAVYEKSSYKKVNGINLDPTVCFGYHIKTISINAQVGLSAPLTSSRRIITNIFTTTDNGAPAITTQEGTATDPLIAGFARLSLQYNFNFSKQKPR